MEEAAQILEVETFIPLMLQNPQDGYNRLKRVVLIGDHHQVSPAPSSSGVCGRSAPNTLTRHQHIAAMWCVCVLLRKQIDWSASPVCGNSFHSM